MKTDCNCKNVTINVCGCCEHDNAGDGEGGTGSGAVGEWKLLGTLSDTMESINLNEIKYSEVMFASVCSGCWQTSVFCKEVIDMCKQAENMRLSIPPINDAGTYRSCCIKLKVLDNVVNIEYHSSNYNLPVYVYYR